MTKTPFIFDLDFTNAAEAAEHLALLGYRRAPMKGLVRRYSAEAWSDTGARLLVLASTTLLPNDAGVVRVNFAEYPA